MGEADNWPRSPITVLNGLPYRPGGTERAFLVLGGNGWKLRDYFTSGRLSDPSSGYARSVYQARKQRAALIVSDFHVFHLRLTPRRPAALRDGPPPSPAIVGSSGCLFTRTGSFCCDGAAYNGPRRQKWLRQNSP
jgi:hypothetical protein